MSTDEATRSAVPSAITTPASQESGIGTLEFTDGYPARETAAKLRDHLDYLHGAEAFMNSIQGHFYWRQLRDMKGSAVVEAMSPLGLTFYARTCGWTLARAHARSGDPVALAEYLGDSDAFDQSITDFSERSKECEDRGPAP